MLAPGLEYWKALHVVLSFPALKVVQTTRESVTSTKLSRQLLRSPHLAVENYI